MKEDKLKKFIKMENKSFEKDFNDEAIWSKIEGRIIEKPKKQSFNWLAAASIVLLLAVGWLTIERFTLTDKVTALEQIVIDGKSYDQIENYYAQSISQKSKLVHEKAKSIDFPLNEDVSSLQQKYEHLKDQLKNNGANDKIIQAMILNLRTQIELLNEQLSIIESINEYVKTEKKQKNETQI